MAEPRTPSPFNLKEVVNFIETHGYHVEAAKELPDEDAGVIESYDGPVIRAINLTITPAAGGKAQEKGGKSGKTRKTALK